MVLLLLEYAISNIRYSKSTDDCSEIPFLALILVSAVETESFSDENTMLSSNAVGGPDFPQPQVIEP